jgi:hypothetical protein
MIKHRGSNQPTTTKKTKLQRKSKTRIASEQQQKPQKVARKGESSCDPNTDRHEQHKQHQQHKQQQANFIS